MRKILVLGIFLILASILTAGLGFGQDIYFRGVSWRPLEMKKLESFDKLGVRLIYLRAADRAKLAGTIRFLIIITKDGSEHEIIAAWYSPYELKNMRGWIMRDNGEPFLTKTLTEGEMLDWRLRILLSPDPSQGNNPILIFYYFKKDAKPEVVKVISIRKFVEENFKSEKSPPEK